jgi:hypothetical protein
MVFLCRVTIVFFLAISPERAGLCFLTMVEAGRLFLVPGVPEEAVLARFRPPRKHK